MKRCKTCGRKSKNQFCSEDCEELQIDKSFDENVLSSLGLGLTPMGSRGPARRKNPEKRDIGFMKTRPMYHPCVQITAKLDPFADINNWYLDEAR